MAQSADSTCLCEICIGGPGDYYCQQCDQLFCENCKSSHLRAKISKKHTFFSGKNINKEEKRLCIEHEERFSFYCHDCETPVCSSCSVRTHQGHLMTDLTKSAVKLKLELVKIIESTITTSTSCIGKIEEDTKTYHQKTKTVNKTITEEGNYYKELIDKQVHSFVKLVQDETQKALGSMSTATKVYLEILENCQQWQKNITEMETKSDVLLVKKLKHLKTDVDQTVLKQSLDTPRPSVSYTNKKLSDTDIDNLFGELTFHRNTDKRPDWNSEEQHMLRYKAERNELKEDSYSSGGGRSATEKENISLRAELTEALQNIENLSKKYRDFLEKYETRKIATQMTIESLQRDKDDLEQENANFRAKLDQIQSDLNRYKNEQVHQQNSSHGTIENLLQKNRKLENDRELLRDKIFSLENEKVKSDDMLNKSKEDHKKLQRDQDELIDSLREKSNELRGSETRIRKLEADILFLQNTKTENDQLKESLREIEGVNREFENLEKRYKKETSDRMSSDNISAKYRDDNDRLRKERNDARTELQRVMQEKKASLYQNLNTENVLAREKLQTKEREKLELVALFKDKEDKDFTKNKTL